MWKNTISPLTKSSADGVDISKLLGNGEATPAVPAPVVGDKKPMMTTISHTVTKNKKDFLKKYAQSAENASKVTGISKDLLLAQVALEMVGKYHGKN